MCRPVCDSSPGGERETQAVHGGAPRGRCKRRRGENARRWLAHDHGHAVSRARGSRRRWWRAGGASRASVRAPWRQPRVWTRGVARRGRESAASARAAAVAAARACGGTRGASGDGGEAWPWASGARERRVACARAQLGFGCTVRCGGAWAAEARTPEGERGLRRSRVGEDPLRGRGRWHSWVGAYGAGGAAGGGGGGGYGVHAHTHTHTHTHTVGEWIAVPTRGGSSWVIAEVRRH